MKNESCTVEHDRCIPGVVYIGKLANGEFVIGMGLGSDAAWNAKFNLSYKGIRRVEYDTEDNPSCVVAWRVDCARAVKKLLCEDFKDKQVNDPNWRRHWRRNIQRFLFSDDDIAEILALKSIHGFNLSPIKL